VSNQNIAHRDGIGQGVDIPPDGHSADCACERCFSWRFYTDDYSRQVTQLLAKSLVGILADDALLIFCWAVNQLLPRPLNEVDLRRVVNVATEHFNILGKEKARVRALAISKQRKSESAWPKPKKSRGVPL